MSEGYKLPKFLSPAFSKKIASVSKENYSIQLNYFPQFDEANNKISFYKLDKFKKENIYNYNFSDKQFISRAKKHYENIEIFLRGGNTRQVKLNPDWRLIVGLGNESGLFKRMSG